jgi:hypothetical protein
MKKMPRFDLGPSRSDLKPNTNAANEREKPDSKL